MAYKNDVNIILENSFVESCLHCIEKGIKISELHGWFDFKDCLPTKKKVSLLICLAKTGRFLRYNRVYFNFIRW